MPESRAPGVVRKSRREQAVLPAQDRHAILYLVNFTRQAVQEVLPIGGARRGHPAGSREAWQARACYKLHTVAGRLLKKVEMQGGARYEARGVLSTYAAAARERANPA